MDKRVHYTEGSKWIGLGKEGERERGREETERGGLLRNSSGEAVRLILSLPPSLYCDYLDIHFVYVATTDSNPN